SREAFLQGLQDAGTRAMLTQLFILLDKHFVLGSESLLTMTYLPTWVQVRVRYQKESARTLLGISLDAERDEKIKVRYTIGHSPSFKELEKNDVQQDSAFFKQLHAEYCRLADEKHQP
ncbi:MAG: hypothetical protein IJM64_07990, partial [Ottowia sp.]|nr:hypothetical protein [Ottowia sp.]